MSDNIGGIVSAEYCPVENVSSCGVTKSGIMLTFSLNNPWNLFPSSLGKINVTVKSNGSTYDVSGEIRCPDHKFASEEEKTFPAGKRVLIRLTNASGKIYIVGSKENPVTIGNEILAPSSPADFNGVIYTLTGTQTHPQLPQIP